MNQEQLQIEVIGNRSAVNNHFLVCPQCQNAGGLCADIGGLCQFGMALFFRLARLERIMEKVIHANADIH